MAPSTPTAAPFDEPSWSTRPQVRSFGKAKLVISHDVDSYMDSIPGMEFDAVRTGRGFGPTSLLATAGDGFVAASAVTRFPVTGRTTMPEGVVTAACVTAAPGGSRWCGIDLVPGTVVVWGPGADHTGRDPAGLGYAFVAAGVERLSQVADQVGLLLDPPPAGEVHTLAPSPRTRVLASTLASAVEAAALGTAPDANKEDDVLLAFATALRGDRRPLRVGGGKGIDSRAIAHACIDYVTVVERVVSIRELCLVAHVSERRLRDAFYEVYGQSPLRFFRTWALDAARRRLTTAEPRHTTVTDVAMNLGFSHFGRFAGRYRALYGETPSATLASVPST